MYKLHPKSKIGIAWIYPGYLEMEEGAKIGHLNIAIHLDSIIMGIQAKVGRSNWITGFSKTKESKHFQHQKDRKSELIIGNYSAITKKHHIDCTNTVEIGNYSTVAGYNSQFLTHSIDIYENRQDSKPIKVGDYCFIGTNSILLGGSILPSYSVLGAKSLLSKRFTDEYSLYGGVPAKLLNSISTEAKYFSRKTGYVY